MSFLHADLPLRKTAVTLLCLALLLTVRPPAADASTVAEGSVGRVEVVRAAGTSRVATAVQVSEEVFAAADTVVITRADAFADALVGAVVAAEVGGPILLTGADAIPAEVSAEINRLGASNAIVLGGESAVSSEAEGMLAETLTVRRISGASRFATAAAAAGEAPNSSTVFLANGANFPDALSAAPYAAFLGSPILLTGADQLPEETANAIADLQPDEIVILGGAGAVGEAVATQAAGLATTVRRIAGDSRWGTSALIYDEAVAAGMSAASRWLATGQNFPDALAAGPAVAAAGGSFLLVPGDDLRAAPVIADRIAAGYCDLDRITLLGGASAITGEAISQLTDLLPVTTECPASTAGDCLTGYPTISEVLTELDPEGDPDGDGFTTAEERGPLAFDPVANPARFNPLIADTPELSVELTGDIAVDLVGRVGTRDLMARATVEQTEATEAREDAASRAVTETFGISSTVESGADQGSFTAKASVTASYEKSTTDTTSVSVSAGARLQNEEAVSNEFERTEDIEGGEIRAAVRVANAGHVDFRMDSIRVNVLLRRVDGTIDPIPVAVVEDTSGPTLTSNGAPVDLQLTASIPSPRLARALAYDLGGVVLDVQQYTLSEIGAGDIRTDAADLDQYKDTITANTATVLIDGGPDGALERYFVSTTWQRNADGTPAGTSLCLALNTVLQKEVTTRPIRLGTDAQSEEFTVLTALSQEIEGQQETLSTDAATRARWVTAVDSGSVSGDLFGLDQINLRAGDSASMVFLQDVDGDLLARSVEALLGLDDDDADFDDDGVDDGTELTPYTINVVRGEGADQPPTTTTYEVTSDPKLADGDNDTLTDSEERAIGTDPHLADTDNDQSPDGDDPDPLDGSTFVPSATPISAWSMDLDSGNERRFRDLVGNQDGFANIPDPGDNGPVGIGHTTDRNGQVNRAYAAGRPSIDDQDEGLVVVEAYTDPNRPNWYDDGFAIAAFVSQTTAVSSSNMALIAGEAGYMGLSVRGTDALVLGPLDPDPDPNIDIDDPGTSLPGPLVAEGLSLDQWQHVIGSAAVDTVGGVDGVTLTIFVNGQPAAEEFYPGTDLVNDSTYCKLQIGAFARSCGLPTGAYSLIGHGVGRNTDRDPTTGLDDVRLFGDPVGEAQALELSRE